MTRSCCLRQRQAPCTHKTSHGSTSPAWSCRSRGSGPRGDGGLEWAHPSLRRPWAPESTGAGAASLCPSLGSAGHVTSPRCQGQLTPWPCSPAQPWVTWAGASGDNISATETEVTWSGTSGRQARHGTVAGTALALGWRGRVESPAYTLHRCMTKDKAKPHHAPAFCAVNRETLDPNGWLTDWPGVHTPKMPGTRVPRVAPQDPAAALSTPGEGASWSLETGCPRPPG